MMELDIVHKNISKEHFLNEIYPRRKPVILRGLDIGSCSEKWTVDYLMSAVGADQEVKVHVSSSSQMDFIKKNFLYRSLSFQQFVKRAAEEEHEEYFIDKSEKFYLRSLGADPRKGVADISVQFPILASDINLPPFFEEEKFFSSVFRIGSKGTQLWTHYDVMDNLLIEVVGNKKVVLFDPKDVDFLYMNGDKSEVLDVDNPDLDRYPLFARATQYTGFLEPGDVLFIPALWLHNVTYMDFGIAVNVFWRHLEDQVYDTKDPYGNRDPMPVQRASQIVDRAVKALEELPLEYQEFYARQLCSRIRSKVGIKDT